jgi:ankyrin repeat protein
MVKAPSIDSARPWPRSRRIGTRQNQTIMHIAAGAGAAEVTEYLYLQGVGLDAKNSMGETPLDLAEHQERYHEAIACEAAEDKPDHSLKGDATTSDTIKEASCQFSAEGR